MSLYFETATPPATGPGLPSLTEHMSVLSQLKGTIEAAAAKVAKLVRAEAMPIDAERLNDKAKWLGKEVERMLREAEGIWVGVGPWKREMEERAMDAAQSLQERNRAKGELEELRKKKRRLQEETTRLLDLVLGHKPEAYVGGQLVDAEAVRQRDEFKRTVTEKNMMTMKELSARKHADLAEQQTANTILELEKVLSERGIIQAEARKAVAETERLREETERLTVEVDHVTFEREWKNVPRD
ncbi:hypothetical protein DFP73DRAFT_567188 [Morchella snyderi]|nr:hypothetical protein DFP73DRAFT_567188 [Morchella snyderi]